MSTFESFYVEMDEKTHVFYEMLAETAGKTLEETLSSTLRKYAEIVMREAAKYDDNFN